MEEQIWYPIGHYQLDVRDMLIGYINDLFKTGTKLICSIASSL